MSHDDSTGEKSDDSRQTHKLTQKISEISIEQNKWSFLDGVFVDRLINFEKITQAKTTQGSKSYTEKEQITKIKGHLTHHFDSISHHPYVNYPPV